MYTIIVNILESKFNICSLLILAETRGGSRGWGVQGVNTVNVEFFVQYIFSRILL